MIKAMAALSRRRRLRRGRDADPAAALRRRQRPPVHDAPQRARPHVLPAHRDRALPQAPDRRRARARLRDRQELPQRGRVVQAQPRVHGVEWYEAYADYSDGMRRTEEFVAAAARRARNDHDHGRRPRGRHGPALARMPLGEAIGEACGIDSMADRDPAGCAPCSSRRGAAAAADDETWAQLVDRLLSHFVEPEHRRAGVPHRLPVRALAAGPPVRAAIPALVERYEAFCAGWSSRTATRAERPRRCSSAASRSRPMPRGG